MGLLSGNFDVSYEIRPISYLIFHYNVYIVQPKKILWWEIRNTLFVILI